MRLKQAIIKIKYHKMILSSKPPNNIILLHDGSIARIEEFIVNGNNEIQHVVMELFSSKEPVFSAPCNSGTMDIREVKRLTNTYFNISLNHIKQNCVNLHLNYSKDEETDLL